MLAAMRWQKITLIGVGLLGGSLGMAVRQKGIASTVHAYLRREASVDECLKSGAADFATLDLQEAVTDADLIVLCTPIAQMRKLVERMLPSMKPDANVTDVGSTKASLVGELGPLVQQAGASFIGSHPMAGSDKTGVQNASANLFKNAICAVTPTEQSDPKSVEAVTDFWKAIGCSTLILSPEFHDKLVSRCSHLPHIVAAELVRYALGSEFPKEQVLLSGTGLKDTTRLASGSPEIWRDICMTNRENLISTLEQFGNRLNEFQNLLKNADPDALTNYFSEVRHLRNQWMQERFNHET